MSYWSEVVQETTTFTLPNPDEYERPEEIREIEVNRVKARSMAVEGDALNFADKLRASLLGQLHESMSDWDDRDLRRSFVHMQVGNGLDVAWPLFSRCLHSLSLPLRTFAAIDRMSVLMLTDVSDLWSQMLYKK